ncbi:MAG: xanthine dehydrogenase family protein subunit M [Pseudomonadota bacterium]
MITGSFEYHQPESLSAAVSLLAELGDDARVIAGGHSLIPMMKLRLAMPEHLIDLQAIDALRRIEVSDGTVRIGAMTTQADLIGDQALHDAAPIVRETALQIADPQVRYMGTVGGNVANGDPGNDMPALMQCLDANFTLQGPDGERTVKARGFYEAAYFTARDDLEILTEVSFAACSGGYAYEKQKRKIGDYATAAAAVLLNRDGDNCTASIALTNLADTPIYCDEASQHLNSNGVNDASIQAAVSSAISQIDPVDDNRGPADFKKHAAAIILERAIRNAWARA